MMMAERADFPAKVRAVVAQRAGYRCSIPTCNRLTIGPGAGPSQIAEIGVASHIYAASPDGPRGTGGLSFDERRSVDNGIWLCADHAKLVDTNAGGSYPASLLQSWKSLHEARNRLELGGHPQPFGWVELLELREAPASLASRQIHLSARNLIVGENATGKSILTKIIAGIGRPDYLAQYSDRQSLSGTVRWYDPRPHELSFHARDGVVAHELDGRRVPYVARPYRTVLLGESPARLRGLASIARVFDLDKAIVANVLVELPQRVDGEIVNVGLVGDTAVVSFRTISDRVFDIVELSTGAVQVLLLELAIAITEVQSQVEPSLLVLDEFMGTMDLERRRMMFSLLGRHSYAFQVVVASVREPPEPLGADWLTTRFYRSERGFEAVQNPGRIESRASGARRWVGSE